MKRLLILVALGLAGCADPHEPLSPDFGNYVRANIAAQVVNPAPKTGGWESDGERIEKAIRRYHTNTVYPPYNPNSAAAFSGGGGGNGAPPAPAGQ
jgi:type IV pilus biogenesis protein CpaD/CtpE